MVETFVQPSFTAQDAATYKANLDRSIAVLAEAGKQFAPRQMATPGLGITIEQGHLPLGASIAATNVTGIGAPATNPRIDRIYYNYNTAVYERVVGTEAATPVAPAYPVGLIFPIAQVLCTVGMTSILNASITDERAWVPLNAIQLAAFNFVNLVDATGIARILIGKPTVDHRIICRMHTDDNGSRVEFQRADGTIMGYMDGAGQMGAEGFRTKEGANKRMGLATLVAGTVVVNTTAVTANSRIFLTSNVPGGTPGWPRVSARTPGTSFTILSSSGTDTSGIAWEIKEPA